MKYFIIQWQNMAQDHFMAVPVKERSQIAGVGRLKILESSKTPPKQSSM